MKNLKKRALPFLLSLAMVLSSLTVPARAEDGISPSDVVIENQTEVTPVETSTEAPKSTEPSTEAPKSTEPSTEAPKPTEPATEAPEPEQPATEAPEPEQPSGEVTDPEEPTTVTADPEVPSGEVTDPEEPTTEAADPEVPSGEVTEPVEPTTEAVDPTEPSGEVTEPVEPTTEAEDPTEPATEPVEPTEPSTEEPGEFPEEVEEYLEGLRNSGADAAEIQAIRDALKAAPGTMQAKVNNILLARLGTLPEADENGVITLEQDYEEKITILAEVEVTIDLNGHKLNTPESSGTELVLVYGKLTITDSSADESGALVGGTQNVRGVRLSSGGSLILEKGTIKGFNTVGNGGGVLVENGCSFIMNGGEISGNTANHYGGGVYAHDVSAVDDEGNVTWLVQFNGGVIKDNAGENGGGIALMSNSAGLANEYTIPIDFTGNKASVHGGAIFADGFAMTVTGTFENNSANERGGAVYLNSISSFTIAEEAVFDSNTAGTYGGAVFFRYFEAHSQKLYVYGTVTNNTAVANSGGAFYVNRAAKIEISGNVSNNSSGANAGAMYAIGDANSVFTVTGTVNNNTAQSSGGAFYIEGNGKLLLDLTRATFTGNKTVSTTAGNGGAIYVSNANVICGTGTTVSNNTAYNGGAFGLASSTTLNINEGAVMEGNYARSTGGVAVNGSVVMTGGTISNNKSGSQGGVFYGSALNASGGKIFSNTSGHYGSVWSANAALTLTGTVEIYDNNQTGTTWPAVFWTNWSSITVSGQAKIHDNHDPYVFIQYNNNHSMLYIKEDAEIYNNEGQAFRTYRVEMTGGKIYNNGSIGIALAEPAHDFVQSKITGGKIYGNKGNGVYSVNPLLIGGDVEIYGNTSGSGAGVYCTAETTINGNASIHDNKATSYGGGVYAGNGLTIEAGTTICGNLANTLGNDIYIPTDKAGTIPAAPSMKDLNGEQKETFRWFDEVNGADLAEAINVSAGPAAYTFVNRDAVAQIGETVYPSVQAAVDDIAAGTAPGTDIFMLKDSTESVVIPEGLGALSLDLKGFTLKALSGRVFSVRTGSEFTLKDTSDDESGLVTGGNAEYGGAVSISAGGTFILESGKISNNYASQNGGAINVGVDGIFYMKGGTVSRNSGRYGGAIVLEGKMIMSGGSIISNTSRADGRGGAIYFGTGNMKGELYINNDDGTPLFENNIAEGSTNSYGGAIYVVGDNSRIEINGGIFRGNKAAYGGAIVFATGKPGVINGGVFENNKATMYSGGALRVQGLYSLTINGGEFKNNTATTYGGAVYSGTSGILTINGGEFTENNAARGGAICADKIGSTPRFTMTGGKIYGNHCSLAESNDIHIIAAVAISLIPASDMGLTQYDSWYEGASGIYYTEAVTSASSTLELTAALAPNVEGDAVARINDVTYAALQIAINAAGDGETIHLLKNITETVTVNGKAVVINLNGFTLSPTGDKVIRIAGAGAVTIEDDDTQDDYNTEGDGGKITPAVDGEGNYIEGSRGVWVTNGTFTLKSGNITGFSGVNYGGAVYGVYSNGKVTINIEGGLITDCHADNGGAIAGQSATVNITGGLISKCSAVNGGAVFMEAITSVTTANAASVGVVFNMTGGSMEDCSATERGGTIYYAQHQFGTTASYSSATAHTFNMNGVSITRSTSGLAGGALYLHTANNVNVADLLLEDVTITDCKAGGAGGAICIVQGGSTIRSGLRLTNVTLSGNRGTSGGAVYTEYTKLTFSGLTAENNTASGSGGAVYAYYSHVITDGSETSHNVIRGNNAVNGSGGGLYFDLTYYSSLTLRLRWVDFEDNHAQANGGALMYSYAANEASAEAPHIANCTFVGNVANNNGGAIWYRPYIGKNLRIADSTIKGNTANRGGALYAVCGWLDNDADVGSMHFTGVIIEENTAKDLGGAFCLYEDPYYCNGPMVYLEEGTIIRGNNTKNHGTIYIYAEGGGARPYSITVNGAQIVNNTVGGNGGAVFFGGGYQDFIMNDGLISGNHANGSGGAVYMEQWSGYSTTVRDIQLNGGEISGNSTDASGGAFYIGSYHNNIIIDGTVIKGNSAVNYGGGFYVGELKTTTHLTDGAVYDNSAGLGQDFYIAFSSAHTSVADLMKAQDMFDGDPDREGIGWYDELIDTVYDGKVTGALTVRAYALTLRYKLRGVVVAVIIDPEKGLQEFSTVTEAFGYIGEGLYTGDDVPEVILVADPTESAQMPGGAEAILNLNGYTLSGQGTSALTVSGKLTIKDEPHDDIVKDETTTYTAKEGGTGTITGSAPVSGGGVKVTGGGECVMESGQIANCIATTNTNSTLYGGAAVCVENGVFELTGTASLNNNKARRFGSAVLVSNEAGTFRMSGGKIENNTVTMTGDSGNCYGGAVYVRAGNAFITGGEICNNSSYTAGAIAIGNGTVSISGTEDAKVLIHDNTTTAWGAGIMVGSGGKLTLSNVEIYNNKIKDATYNLDTIDLAGGGIYTNGTVNIAEGTVIRNNYATRGGGIYIRTGTVTMVGGRITQNEAQIGGGVGMWHKLSGVFKLANGFLAGNASLRTGDGNDVYTYPETGATTTTGEHPKVTLIQAAAMGDPNYTVWRKDDYTGNTVILMNEDGTIQTSYIENDCKMITGYVLSSINLKLTADKYVDNPENAYDNDMHVTGVIPKVVADGTAGFDTGSASGEKLASQMLAAGVAGFSLSDQTYTLYSMDGAEVYHYIEYTGPDYENKLYEQKETVTWVPGDDSKGNEKTGLNYIVRSFDTIQYTAFMAIEPDELAVARERKIRYWTEVEIPFSPDEVEFDVSKITGGAAGGGGMVTRGGFVILTGQNDQGQTTQRLRVYWDADLTVSTNSGDGNSIQPVAELMAAGLMASENEEVDSFAAEMGVVLKVYGLKNGEKIQPLFRAWVEDNPAPIPYGRPEIITVSAAPKYNVTIEGNDTLYYTSYFDLKTGEELSKTDAAAASLDHPDQVIYGTMLGYGVTVSLYNDEGKELKGIELPDTPLEFDLRFHGSMFLDGQPIDNTDAGAYIWAYKENANTKMGRELGGVIDDRNMDWNDEDDRNKTTQYAYNAAPFNNGGGSYSCYSGGTWVISGDQYNGTDKEMKVHVKVSGYQFDVTTLPNYASDQSTGKNFNSKNIKPFTAGYVQVIFPFDSSIVTPDREIYLSIGMGAAVCDLDAVSISGQDAITRMDEEGNPVGLATLEDYFDGIDLPEGDTVKKHATDEMLFGDNYVYKVYGIYLEPPGVGPGDVIYKYNDWYTAGRAQISGDKGQGSTPLKSIVYMHGWAQFYGAAYRTDDERDPLHYIAPEDFNTQTDNLVEYNYMTAMNLLQKFDADAYTPMCTTKIVDQAYDLTSSNSIASGMFYITTDESATTWSNNKSLSGRLTVLYGAKPDGSNWAKGETMANYDPDSIDLDDDNNSGDVWESSSDHTIDNDGGTREMDWYREENLIYFTSMAELKAYFEDRGISDAVCVALLYEFRDIVIRTTRTLGVQARMQVTDDFERVGHTYETTNDVRAWSTYRHTYKALYRTDASYAYRQDLLYLFSYRDEVYAADASGSSYTAYGVVFPVGTVYRDTDNDPEIIVTKTRGSGEYSTKYLELPTPRAGYEGLWTGVSAQRYNNGYIKTEYVHGNMLKGTHNGWRAGNNLLLYTLDSAIAITTTDHDIGSNDRKTHYNVTNGERIAHYEVTPSLTISSSVQNHELVVNGTQETAIEITLELPEHLHYNEGSLQFDYSHSGYAEGELSWNVTVNVDPVTGKTTITLTTDVYDISKALPTFSYSCTIGDPDLDPEKDVVNGESLNTVATIRAKYTSVNEICANAHSDQVAINVTKSNDSAISKTVGETLVEIGEDLVYVLRLHNLNDDPKNFTFGDILPYNNDGRDTDFTGGYQVKTIVIEFSKAEDYNRFKTGGYLYYLKDRIMPDAVGGLKQLLTDAATAGNDVASISAVNWDETNLKVTYTLNADALVQLANVKKGIALTTYLPYISGANADKTVNGIHMTITLNPLDSTPASDGSAQLITDGNGKQQTGNNIYGNAFFYHEGQYDSDVAIPVNSSLVEIVTIDRRISGRVWLDQDQDGLYNPGAGTWKLADHAMKDVTVSLLEVEKEVTSVTQDQNGHNVYTYDYHTDENDPYGFGWKWIPAKDIIGNDLTDIKTDKNGYYCFANLAPGKYLVVFTDGTNQYILGDAANNATADVKHPMPFERLSVSLLDDNTKNAGNGNKSEPHYDGEDVGVATGGNGGNSINPGRPGLVKASQGQLAELDNAALYTVVDMPSKQAVQQIGGQYYSPNWNAALYYIDATVEKDWTNLLTDSLPAGAKVSFHLKGTTEGEDPDDDADDLLVYEGDVTMTWNADGTVTCETDLPGYVATAVKVEHVSENNLYIIKWKLEDIRLQAEGSTGKVTYEFTEVKVENVSSMSLKKPAITVTQDGDTTIFTAENQQILHNFSLTKAALEEIQRTLAGAEFQLADATGAVLNFEQAVKGIYHYVPAESQTSVKSLATNALGQLTFMHLPGGTYTLTETKAPAGREKAEGSWTVEITYDADNDATIVTITANNTSEGLLFKSDADAEDGYTPSNSFVVTDGDVEIRIANSYTPVPAELEVKKELEGREWETDDVFEFTLAPGTATYEDGKTGTSPMPAGTNADGNKVVTITKDDAPDYTKGFGEAKYTLPGTYKYTITETWGSADGMTYDTTSYEVTVTVVEDETGALAIESVEYGEKDSLTVINTFKPTEEEIKVEKKLTGREWENDDTFTFTLTPVDGAPMPKDADGQEQASVEVTITKDTPDYRDTFGKIEYRKAGTYTYKVKETKGTLDGVTYDIEEKTITVTVERNEDTNVLTATVNYPEGELAVVVENPFKPAKGQILVQKDLTGRDWETGDSFIFTLTPVDGAPMPKDSNGDPQTSVEVTVTGPGAYSFGIIEFMKAGTYQYEVQETKGTLDGVTYDISKKTVTITVTKDDDTNALTATVNYPEGFTAVVVENPFKPAEEEIFVQKELEGRKWETDDYFDFTLAPVKDAPMPEETDEDGTKTVRITKDTENYMAGFGTIKFNKAGTYEYTITEVHGTLDGVEYVSGTRTVTVTVTKDKDTNALSAEVKYGEPNKEGTAELFINKFTPAEEEIFVQKELQGRDWETDDFFRFTLRSVKTEYEDGTTVNSAPLPKPEGDGAQAQGKVAVRITKDDAPDYRKSFGVIKFNKAGTYYYTIDEAHGTLDGVEYVEGKRNIIVTVTKDKDTNALTATVTYDSANEAGTAELFINKFTPAPAEILVEKELKGRDWETDDYFDFTLAPVKDAPMPEGTDEDGTKTVRITKDTENYRTSFGEIKFNKAGTYQYTITEVHGTLDGVEYVSGSRTVTVTVTKDDKTNALSAAVKYSDPNKEGTAELFINKFTPAEEKIFVQKELEGRKWETDDYFDFTLAPVDGAPMPDGTDEDGTKTVRITKDTPDFIECFGTIKFNKAGTYQYTITEVHGTLDGVEYVSGTRTVTVTVTKDDKTNALSAAVKYSDPNKEGTAELFVNKFTPAVEQIFVQKQLDGREWETEDYFDFTLAPVDGAPMPDGTDADGTKTVRITKDLKNYTAGFGKIEFMKAGTYNYTITEVHGTLDGVEYVEGERHITVTVTKDPDTNALTAEVTYDSANEAGTAELFINKFTPVPAEILVEKKLDGRDWETDDYFDFTLAPVKDAPMPDGTDEDGTKTVRITKDTPDYMASFGKIEFKKAGTYNYTITEVHGTLDGVEYVEGERTITVTVEKDKDTNALSATVTYDSANEAGTAELFVNKFTPAYAEIGVQKELKGREWETDDYFDFTLAPVDGAPMPDGTDEDGTKTVRITKDTPDYTAFFGEMTFMKAGTYKYTVKEVHGTLDGVTYDAAEYPVKVVVTRDEKTNVLVATLVFADAEAKVQVILNTFTPTDEELKVRKELEGREWRDGDYFRFKLTAGEATYEGGKTGTSPMPEGAEDDGTLIITVEDAQEYSFGKMIFKKAGTYKYTIEEIDDGLPGITYDTTPREITITVEKDPDTNALTATVDEDKNISVFVNPYESEGEIVFEAEKILKNKTLEDHQFSFVLKDADGNEIQTAFNDADGKVTFDAISFTQDDFLQEDGTYAETITRVYTMNEVIPDPKEEWYAYDEGIYTITVELTDNGDGTITYTKKTERDGEEVDLAKFTNSYDEPEWTEREVIKKWDDNNNYLKKRPKYITVHLFADGKEILTDKITEADGWKKTFVKLRKYDENDGHEIKYTVTEDKVPGYTVVIDGMIIKNAMINTGDNSMMTLWSSTLGASTLALGAVVLLKRKKEEEEE